MPPENSSALPDSAEGLTNIHDGTGLDDFARRRIWPGTIVAIEAAGYELKGSISSGGTSVVFEVREPSGGRPLAVKVIVEPGKSNSLACFRREVKMLGSEHVPTNVVPFMTFSRDPDPSQAAVVQPFMIIEKIEGKPILEYVLDGRPMAVDDRVRLVERCFEALERLHSCNLLHGDPSPGNVLIQRGDVVRLIDLGQAKTLQGVGTRSLTLTGGTRGYASDARLRGEERSAVWTDIHALASVAFHALTGKAPCKKSGDEAANSDALARAGVAPEVARIILKAMRDKDARLEVDPSLYQTAAEVAKDLRAWREAVAEKARAELRRLERRAHRKQLAWVCLGFSLTVAGVWLHFWWKSQAELRAGQGNEIVALRRERDGLSQGGHPLVKNLDQRADQLAQQRDAALARGETARVDQLTPELIATLRQSIALRRGLEHSLPMREGLGKTLLKVPWVVEAETIARRKDELTRTHAAIVAKFDRGETKSAWDDLHKLSADLGDLLGENTLAMKVAEPRARLGRIRNAVSPKLREQGAADPAFASLTKDGEAAETAWKLGDWTNAGRLFDVSRNALERWLEGKETAEELANRRREEQSSGAIAAQRERDLLAEIERLKGLQSQIQKLESQITMLNGLNVNDRAAAEKASKDYTTERDAHAATKSELAKEAAAKQKALADLSTERNNHGQTKKNLSDKDGELKQALADAAAWRKEAQSRGVVVPPSSVAAKDWVGRNPGDLQILRYQGLEIRFRWCPPGTFKMGDPTEKQVDVTLTQGFWLMETELTQALWQAAGGKALNWEYGQSPEHPAYNMTYIEAEAFIADLNERLHETGELTAGFKLALPTEAQWEYAARAGTTTRYAFDGGITKLGDYAWFGDNAEHTSHPVAKKKANRWGFHDMAGNVWEWCSDRYDPTLKGGIDPRGAEGGPFRVIRGGSWSFSAGDCAAAYRDWGEPSNTSGDLGLRLARVPSGS